MLSFGRPLGATDHAVDPRLLRALRAPFAVCVVLGAVGRALGGDSSLASVGGGVLGGVAFLPVGLLAAALSVAYSLGRRRSGGPT